jgi:hypothetical protein
VPGADNAGGRQFRYRGLGRLRRLWLLKASKPRSRLFGCTVEGTDITAKGDGYKADDVECKDGNYDMLLDKDFKITNKEKED